MRIRFFVLGLFLLSAGMLWAVEAGWHTIHNDFYWVDQDGARVNTDGHGRSGRDGTMRAPSLPRLRRAGEGVRIENHESRIKNCESRIVN